ncbi:hypothetical protein BC939DRAFT_307851 [Gamsiella multidivaricata]|uniref:uncharacterized protein n=1 Tax=Gamsiella multidivaricata TaxID=101098 RepID=UPI0022202B1E|nr:uncharacterized protein BC939DRAFT_307851 [Gamsiella multidivaricata]KAI7818009.1 hypothetical protein BC939DRAFT_307851 [Gamsiella multidivaricata]
MLFSSSSPSSESSESSQYLSCTSWKIVVMTKQTTRSNSARCILLIVVGHIVIKVVIYDGFFRVETFIEQLNAEHKLREQRYRTPDHKKHSPFMACHSVMFMQGVVILLQLQDESDDVLQWRKIKKNARRMWQTDCEIAKMVVFFLSSCFGPSLSASLDVALSLIKSCFALAPLE